MSSRERSGPAKAGRLAFGLVLGLAATGPLTACGFQPLYGDAVSGDVVEEFAQTRVAPIPDRSGQILRNYLIRSLNPTGRPTTSDYVLNVGISETSQELNVQDTSVATRANLVVTANYALATAGGDPVAGGTVRTITSYNILRDEFATLAARRSALDRALRQASDDIRTRLALHFNRTD